MQKKSSTLFEPFLNPLPKYRASPRSLKFFLWPDNTTCRVKGLCIYSICLCNPTPQNGRLTSKNNAVPVRHFNPLWRQGIAKFQIVPVFLAKNWTQQLIERLGGGGHHDPEPEFLYIIGIKA
jgi:hypothetical protein